MFSLKTNVFGNASNTSKKVGTEATELKGPTSYIFKVSQ